jgi:hypothetical protein
MINKHFLGMRHAWETDAHRVLGHWEDPGVDERIILKLCLEKWDGRKEVSNFN